MKKRLVSVLLAFVLAAGMLPTSFASDLEGHWAKAFIEYLDQEGVINASATTGNYEPNRDMTRAEFMRYINRAFHFTEQADISFSDVQSNAWYYETIRIAVKYGYINGVGNNRMEPLGEVTREQAAVIIGRLYKDDPGDVAVSDLPFADRDSISAWAAGYIKAAVDKGIITGYADGTYRPKNVVTRAEVAKIIYYYLGTSLSTAGKAYTGADLKSDTANVTISESCTLSNATIQGDLYITEGVGSDVVTLNNVTVNGTIIVSGGTVTMMNTASDCVIVSSPMGRLLQVTATGAAHIGQTRVQTAAALYEQGDAAADGAGFADITVEGDGRVSLTLDAVAGRLRLAGEAIVSMTAAAEVYSLQVEQPSSITGYGAVYQADIRANGVSFASSIALSGYTLGDGITATIGGRQVDESSEAGVVPSSIRVDLDETDALGEGVSITVPGGLTVSRVTCGGKTLAAGTDYVQTSKGIRVQAAYLSGLAAGGYALSLELSDGTLAAVPVTVSGGADGEEEQTLTFDRYYRAAGFRDVVLQVSGAHTAEDVTRVVLGLSSLDWTFTSAERITLRRGELAQLRAGSYTVVTDLRDGGTQSAVLTVQDSTPEQVRALVAEYNTYEPVEPVFRLPLEGRTVRSIAAERNDAVQLTEGTDYQVSGSSVTMTRAGVERFRQKGGLVEFRASLSDGAEYLLVVDYIA